MLKLTLDTNCIIAVDEDRELEAACLRSLVKKHDVRKIPATWCELPPA